MMNKIALGPTLSRRQVVGGMLAATAAISTFSFGARAFADEAAEAPALTDGTYESVQPGVNGDVTVSVTIAEGKISDVQVTDSAETAGIGASLVNKNDEVVAAIGETPADLLPRLIVENNSIGLDSVTGATITSAAILNAVSDCIEQAGGDPEAFKTPVAYEARTDGAADVVVVGGGGAGLVAAIAAAQQGKTVAIIEKNGSCGGDTLVCGGIYNAPDEALQSKVEMTDAVKSTVEAALEMTSDDPDKQAALEAMQEPVRAQWDEYKASGRTDLFDTQEWYALQTWINGDMVADPELVKVLTYSAYDGLQWLVDLGWEYSENIGQGAGSLWQRTHSPLMMMGTGLISTYGTQIAEMTDQITVYTECTATELVQGDDGKIVGVVATDNHTGESFTVTANSGVILSTGGFSANGAMVQENNTSGKWPDLSEVATTNRTTCSQGEGVAMAQALGNVSLTDMDQIQLLYLGNTVDGHMTKYPPRVLSGTDQVIFINKEGERFVQEDGRRDQICLAVFEQTDKMFYFLESGDGAGYKDIHDPEWRSDDGFTFEYLEENGYITWDDTLEGLAGKLGMDPATLQATVDAFNASVDSGDDAFGRTLFSTKLENGPWVATPRQACIHHTMGGVTIDPEARVLDESGAAIAGLYAAGEVTGGIHGGNRLGGNAVVDTVVFGRLAATTLSSEA